MAVLAVVTRVLVLLRRKVLRLRQRPEQSKRLKRSQGRKAKKAEKMRLLELVALIGSCWASSRAFPLEWAALGR